MECIFPAGVAAEQIQMRAKLGKEVLKRGQGFLALFKFVDDFQVSQFNALQQFLACGGLQIALPKLNQIIGGAGNCAYHNEPAGGVRCNYLGAAAHGLIRANAGSSKFGYYHLSAKYKVSELFYPPKILSIAANPLYFFIF